MKHNDIFDKLYALCMLFVRKVLDFVGIGGVIELYTGKELFTQRIISNKSKKLMALYICLYISSLYMGTGKVIGAIIHGDIIRLMHPHVRYAALLYLLCWVVFLCERKFRTYIKE